MSSRLPPGWKLPSDWKLEDVVTIQGYKLGSRRTGTYRGTVDAAGRPHGRGDFDVTEGRYAYSGGYDGGVPAAAEAWKRELNGDVYAGAMRGGLPRGRGVYHRAGAKEGRLEC